MTTMTLLGLGAVIGVARVFALALGERAKLRSPDAAAVAFRAQLLGFARR